MLTIFTSEGASTPQRARLVEAVVEQAREAGLAGASVIRGVEGFGHSRRRRTTRFADVATDLPVVVQFVDSNQRIMDFVPVLRTLVGDELVVLQPVEIEHSEASHASDD